MTNKMRMSLGMGYAAHSLSLALDETDFMILLVYLAAIIYYTFD